VSYTNSVAFAIANFIRLSEFVEDFRAKLRDIERRLSVVHEDRFIAECVSNIKADVKKLTPQVKRIQCFQLDALSNVHDTLRIRRALKEFKNLGGDIESEDRSDY
jgi:hypothetical protein